MPYFCLGPAAVRKNNVDVTSRVSMRGIDATVTPRIAVRGANDDVKLSPSLTYPCTHHLQDKQFLPTTSEVLFIQRTAAQVSDSTAGQ